MMPNISRGGQMSGLLYYLQGPGKANEHSDPHLVAGDPAIMAWHDDNELSRVDARAIAAQLDEPRRVFGTEVTLPTYSYDGDGRRVRAGNRDANVWHCSLSLRAGEGQLTDQRWGAIAAEFMDEMGFTDTSGRSPARWVAVRHGVSKQGNDHVHIVATTVREDGTKVNTYKDQPRSQTVAAGLERRYGLEVLESRGNGLTGRGNKPAELARAQRRDEPEPAKPVLGRTVRACASASTSEAEFVRRMRTEGLLVRARFASGRDDVVTGYSVAQRPSTAQRAQPRDSTPVWYGGGQLDKDLTLPRLREEWEDTPQSSAEAVAEWRAARRQHPVVHGGGRETIRIDSGLVERAGQDLQKWNDYLRSIPLDDRAQWARAAGRTAGVLAAWSRRVEPTPGPLAAASDALARSAQLPAHQRAPKKAGALSAGGAALIMMAASSATDTTVAYTVVLRQVMKAGEAIRDAHQAAGDAQRAAQVTNVIRTQLAAVHAQLPPISESSTEPRTAAEHTPALSDAERDAIAVQEAVTASFPVPANHAVRMRPGSAVPAKVEPNRDPRQTGPRRGAGHER